MGIIWLAMHLWSLLGAALVGSVAAKPLQTRYAVKETHIVPPEFEEIGPAPANHLIRLQIGLKQGQFEELERHLYESM